MKIPGGVIPGEEKMQIYMLKLYVAGDEQNSRLAKDNLTRICEEYLKDRFNIEEVDVLTDFAAALKDRVFVTPTLVLATPEPRATIVGNLADKARVISALRLRSEYGT
ncbi:MAG: Circadian clock protein KaiB [Syntrophus sp. SKADARSKE-3]|nr:Circadian clock protein KaiB [Syntrophus sp. SKADARSKE-3]